MTSELAIGEGTKITLYFSLEMENGDLIDSNFDKKSPTFIFGDGSLMGAFEEAIVGMVAGDKNSFTIPPEKGFGQPNDNNFQTVSRTSFDSDIELEKGLVISFADPKGGEFPGIVKSFDDDEVVIDFNHPLSGRTIIFNVEVIDVKPSVTH